MIRCVEDRLTRIDFFFWFRIVPNVSTIQMDSKRWRATSSDHEFDEPNARVEMICETNAFVFVIRWKAEVFVVVFVAFLLLLVVRMRQHGAPRRRRQLAAMAAVNGTRPMAPWWRLNGPAKPCLGTVVQFLVGWRSMNDTGFGCMFITLWPESERERESESEAITKT